MTFTKRIYLPIIIFGILGFLLIVFVILPLFKEIKTASQEFYLEKNKIVYLGEERDDIHEIENIYQTYQSDMDKIDNLLFDPGAPVGFISFLEKTAADCRIKLEISSMSKKTGKEDLWPSLSLQLLTTGSFVNFSKFLEKIENGTYLIETADLNARKLSEKEISAKELKDIPGADASIILSIKVFTR